MKYLSLFSGIEAASVAWRSLGWECVAVAEIEPFPCAVLEHHFPSVPNLGDVTKITERQIKDLGPIDLVVGGSPCQSFSVAGLRKGLDDPRGNLTLEFLRIIKLASPAFVTWENVPGILTDKTQALHAFLDGLEALGYVIDIDILDAQFFGLAQRRRRIFVCGQHKDNLLGKRTTSSALTIAQCLIEILALRFQELLAASKSTGGESTACELAVSAEPSDGIARRMRLFSLGDSPGLQTALAHLELLSLHSGEDHKYSESSGRGPLNHIAMDISSWDTKTERKYWSTESLPKSLLGDLCWILNLSTTSTATSRTTSQAIFTCSQAVLSIASRIAASNPSSPSFWSAASSALTALEAFTNYARLSSEDLFGDPSRVHAWLDFIKQAERASQSLADTRVRNFGEILPLAESLRGNSPPRRQSGQGTSGTLSASAKGGGGLGTDFECAGGVVAHTLTGVGFDASEDGTGRGTPLVSEIVPPLDASYGRLQGVDGQALNLGHPHLIPTVAWCLQERDSKGADSSTKEGHLLPVLQLAPCVAIQDTRTMQKNQNGMGLNADGASYTLDQQGAQGLHHGMAVRRLTPRECERLQGFPDDFTLIPWRGKPAEERPDGNRYRALGNSMACNVLRWLGQRIEMVDKLTLP